MTNHTNRSGAISAELFAAILDSMMSVSCADRTASYDCVPSRDYLKHRILEATLIIAAKRAARKFGWICQPLLEVDLWGYVHSGDGSITPTAGLIEEETEWLQAEIAKISRKALAVLETV